MAMCVHLKKHTHIHTHIHAHPNTHSSLPPSLVSLAAVSPSSHHKFPRTLTPKHLFFAPSLFFSSPSQPRRPHRTTLGDMKVRSLVVTSDCDFMAMGVYLERRRGGVTWAVWGIDLSSPREAYPLVFLQDDLISGLSICAYELAVCPKKGQLLIMDMSATFGSLWASPARNCLL